MSAGRSSAPPPAAALWVILPAFNEAAGLPQLLSAIEQVDHRWHVVVVDDGSTDGTGTIARAHTTRLAVTVLEHGTNCGLAAAMRTGIEHVCEHAAADAIIVTMDADNTHLPEQIPEMIDAIRGGADVVIASRFIAGAKQAGVPHHRAFLTAGVGWLLRLRFGLAGVRDYSCGFRAYRAAVLRRALAAYGARLIESRGFVVMTELLVKMAPFAPRIVEVPLHLRYDRKVGPSKMPAARTIGGYLRLILARSHLPIQG